MTTPAQFKHSPSLPSANTRLMAMQPSTLNADARTLDVIACTDTPIRRYGVDEILTIAPDAIDLSRVALGQVKVLDSHALSSVNDVLGSVVDTRFEPHALVATIKFHDTPAANSLMARVASQDITGVSVGYGVRAWQRDSLPDADVEQWRATKWELYELSFVAAPADPFAGVRNLDARHNALPFVGQMEKNMDMDGVNTREAQGDGTPVVMPDHAAKMTDAKTHDDAVSVTRAVERERKRTADIFDIANRLHLDNQIASDHIARGTSVDAFRAVVLDILAEQSPTRKIASGTHIEVTNPGESPLEVRQAMVDGLALRFMQGKRRKNGEPVIANEQRAREYANASLLDLAYEVDGKLPPRRMSPGQKYDDIERRAMMGTSDFPNLLSNLANKFLLQQYEYQEPSYRQFSALRSFNDYKDHNFLRGGDFPILQKKAPNGQYVDGSMSENKEKVYAQDYGVIVEITKEILVNDDLSYFADLTGLAGRRVSDFENNLAWSIIKANPIMLDNSNLWNTTAPTYDKNGRPTNTGHNNYQATGTALNIASIHAARSAMMFQRSLDGVPLNNKPKILVVGPLQYTAAQQLVSTDLLATQIGNINPFNKPQLALELVEDAYITDFSFYLYADPIRVPTFVYGYLKGYEGPQFVTNMDFRSSGFALKVTEDFGFGAIDWRGAYLNAGAATT